MGLILSEERKTSHSIMHGAAAAANPPGQSGSPHRSPDGALSGRAGPHFSVANSQAEPGMLCHWTDIKEVICLLHRLKHTKTH